MNALRPLAPEDSPTLLRWRNLPEVSRYMLTDHAISAEEHAAWFDRTLSRDDVKYWIITADGVDVGVTNLTDVDYDNETCFWAFYLADTAVRGKGIGAFAEFTVLDHVFLEMKFRKLSSEVLATNPRTWKMQERFGFVREGCLREQIQKADGPVDVYRLGMLAREWEAAREGHRQALVEKGILPS